MEVIKNHQFQLIFTLIVGVALGVFFMTTTEIEETTEKRYKEEISQLREAVEKTSHLLKTSLQTQKEFAEETSRSTSSYEQTIRNLKSKVVEKTYKIIKPDGTIIEKSFKQSETEEYNSYVKSVTEEFNRKIKSIESRWKTIHHERISEIIKIERAHYEKKLESKTWKMTRINPKKANAELGYTTANRYYGHLTYSLWGPVTLGGHIDSNTGMTDTSVGLGLGISF